MKEKDLSTMTVEELKKTMGIMKGATIGLGVMMAILLVATSYIIFVQNNTAMIALFVMPVAFMPIMLMNSKKIKEYQAEIANRG